MPPQLPRRRFGNSQDTLSIIGFGAIIVMREEQPLANRMVAEAIELGVNYFDVAPAYQDAEERLGPAIEPYRDRIFLACKTAERTAQGARADLERSFQRLRTDHLDLYQFHALTDVEKDVKAIFAKGGAMETVEQARRDGRLRYVGFSAHSEEAALEALDLYPFDSVLFPVTYAPYMQRGFGPRVVEKAEKQGAARLALKAMAKGRWKEGDALRDTYWKAWYEPIVDERAAQLALRWTLSQPITAAIPPGHHDLFRLAARTALEFSPITPPEVEELEGLLGNVGALFPLPA